MIFNAKNTDEMIKIGEEIARICSMDRSESAKRVLFLEGDLGVGKTTLTAGMARALGVAEEVTSPSFVINKKYYGGGGELLLSHYDFYRLGDEVGLMEDELGEDLKSGATVVVEWGGEVEEILPEKYWRVRILQSSEDESRKIELEEVKI